MHCNFTTYQFPFLLSSYIWIRFRRTFHFFNVKCILRWYNGRAQKSDIFKAHLSLSLSPFSYWFYSNFRNIKVERDTWKRWHQFRALLQENRPLSSFIDVFSSSFETSFKFLRKLFRDVLPLISETSYIYNFFKIVFSLFKCYKTCYDFLSTYVITLIKNEQMCYIYLFFRVRTDAFCTV